MSEPLNVLIVGTDDGGARSDVVLLARWVPASGEIRVLSLPRDLWVQIPCPAAVHDCRSPDKLAHAYAYGEIRGGPGGPQLVASTVDSLLGVSIDHWIRFDFKAFEQAVDALGGVHINVEKRMYYDDPYQDLLIDLQPGEQTLNGKQALGYVRFRNDELGDIGRIGRTQQFLQALLATARAQGLLSRAPALAQAIIPLVDSDLDAAAMLSLARAAQEFRAGSLKTATIPGAPAEVDGLWVWQPDTAAARQLAEEYLLAPPSTPGQE